MNQAIGGGILAAEFLAGMTESGIFCGKEDYPSTNGRLYSSG